MQTLDLRSERGETFVVVTAAGELDLHNQDQFERLVCDHLESSPVVVDLSGLDFFSISALRALIVCHHTSASTGHPLSFAEPSRQLLRLLAICGLDGVLPLGRPAPAPAPTVAAQTLAAPTVAASPATPLVSGDAAVVA